MEPQLLSNMNNNERFLLRYYRREDFSGLRINSNCTNNTTLIYAFLYYCRMSAFYLIPEIDLDLLIIYYRILD